MSNLDPVNRIIFVCEHGAAKSILAAAYCNHLAAQIGIDLVAEARGTNPDAELSQDTVRGLSNDGLEPTEMFPQKLSPDDMSAVRQIVSFCELPLEYRDKISVEHWEDVPPVSADYEKARDAIVKHLEQLLDNIRRSS